MDHMVLYTMKYDIEKSTYNTGPVLEIRERDSKVNTSQEMQGQRLRERWWVYKVSLPLKLTFLADVCSSEPYNTVWATMADIYNSVLTK